MDDFIQERVKRYFVEGDNNCAMTVLRVLSEIFGTPVPPEVLAAAGVMPGAGGVGGLCGLVSGVLMFLGVWGGQHGYHRSQIKPISQEFMQQVEQHFGSSLCCDLKPAEGDCSALAERFLSFTIPYLHNALKER
ncbi:MAG: putative redox-active protein (C_GCAxxG_C_C) [Planctomycetes bacterium ADurb.Bin126]|nr:MAG: putative redox-active protein (C_GCAxxG_C_C) [Planctomycetes bacterium ADurb.Bin126]